MSSPISPLASSLTTSQNGLGTDSMYSYVIQSKNDITQATYQRRLLKKNKSFSRDFLFDLSRVNLDVNYVSFLDEVVTSQDQILFRGEQRIVFRTLTQNRKPSDLVHNVLVQELNDLSALEGVKIESHERIIFKPLNLENLNTFAASNVFKKAHQTHQAFWSFTNYDSTRKKSLTVQDIGSFVKRHDIQTLPQMPYWSSQIPEDYELEPLVDIEWSTQTKIQEIQLSIIIPTYNNCLFLTNVIRHLLKQNIESTIYEIIVVDDGSTDYTSQAIQSLISDLKTNVNFKFIYWTKKPEGKAPQNFFRAGLARNLGVHHASGEYLFFLDSDMVVPEDFITTVLENLKTADIVQFQRYHLRQNESLENPSYSSVDLKTCYIEETNYWSNLFFAQDWMQLENYWKYTCTYALGIKKADFIRSGRFKRHYISYGFEDTDIGYRMYLMKKQFRLIQKPLIHLTAYNQQQYQNSKFLRDQLLRKTSRLFFLDHLTPEVYQTFNFYYKFEKPLTAYIKDLF